MVDFQNNSHPAVKVRQDSPPDFHQLNFSAANLVSFSNTETEIICAACCCKTRHLTCFLIIITFL